MRVSIIQKEHPHLIRRHCCPNTRKRKLGLGELKEIVWIQASYTGNQNANLSYWPVWAFAFNYSSCPIFDSLGGDVAMLRDFSLGQPLQSQELRQWCLLLALAFLKRFLFESLEETLLVNLMCKTVFLTPSVIRIFCSGNYRIFLRSD